VKVFLHEISFLLGSRNSILQVEHANHLRSLGQSKFDSLMNANRERLRPILMTTIAFVAGMAPLIVSKGVSAGFNRATASIVIGGQTLSLLLTLVAVPVFHRFVDSMKERFARRGAKLDLGEDTLDDVVEMGKRHSPHAASAAE
jgi:Cu/Ag efflux pump CusA